MLVLARAAGAIEVPGSGGHLTMGGYLDGLAVAGTQDAQRQRPQALLDLHLDGVANRWLRGRLDLRGRIGGPFEGGRGVGFYNYGQTFQNVTPSVELSEAWTEVRGRKAELRLGIQKVAWGKLDGIPPSDVVNPRDFHDPIVEDFEERKIGIPAALGTYYLPSFPKLKLSELRASLIWVPFAVPPRLALIEERWFPSSIVVPDTVTIPAKVLAQAGLPGPLTLPVNLATQNHSPPRTFDAGGVGFRLGGTWWGSDWDIYHYTGPETGPDLDLRPELVLSLTPPSGHVDSRLRQAHDTMHMTGFDFASPIGAVTVRAEAAFFQDRPYLRKTSDLISPQALNQLPVKRILAELGRRHGVAAVPLGELFPTLDSIEWGIGADTVWHGFQPLVQLNQIAILGKAPALVLSDPETRGVVSLRKRVFEDRIEFEGRGVWAFERGAWFVFPRVSYRARDDLRLRVGYLAIGGPRLSMIGQFRENDEVVLDARYTF
jgi:hypothetical protein